MTADGGQRPTAGNGKICYVEIPTSDVEASASFYVQVFVWTTRRRGNGSLGFDDAVGGVSGTWLTGRKIAMEPRGGLG